MIVRIDGGETIHLVIEAEELAIITLGVMLADRYLEEMSDWPLHVRENARAWSVQMTATLLELWRK